MNYYCYYDLLEKRWSSKCWKRLGDLKNHLYIKYGFNIRRLHNRQNEEEFNTRLMELDLYELNPDSFNVTFSLHYKDKEWVTTLYD